MAYQQPCLTLSGTRKAFGLRDIERAVVLIRVLRNADGFGVGWYAQQAPVPCVFTSLKPAWNDPNLRNLSDEAPQSVQRAFRGLLGAVPADLCPHPGGGAARA